MWGGGINNDAMKKERKDAMLREHAGSESLLSPTPLLNPRKSRDENEERSNSVEGIMDERNMQIWRIEQRKKEEEQDVKTMM
jgi:hypothetical protein